MLYVGMKHSTFCWHYEDNKLYSISFNHKGADRTWYGVPHREQKKYEQIVEDEIFLIFKLDESPEELVMGKTSMFSPAYLMKCKCDVVKVTQREGDFVITFPGAYHSGFGHGFSVCEAVNFALDDWLPILQETTLSMRKNEEENCYEMGGVGRFDV
eukprot:TRINITY_DN1996_c0_g1_i1.p2 TRINITY_DN1996_c0_g1~~TRINITY_DN1996_c0_g1_i1.p2  ORF type:complete len:156 (+),score=33.71 TRINITY_DN1996_c0_g1_i1:91-558(+)